MSEKDRKKSAPQSDPSKRGSAGRVSAERSSGGGASRQTSAGNTFLGEGGSRAAAGESFALAAEGSRQQSHASDSKDHQHPYPLRSLEKAKKNPVDEETVKYPGITSPAQPGESNPKPGPHSQLTRILASEVSSEFGSKPPTLLGQSALGTRDKPLDNPDTGTQADEQLMKEEERSDHMRGGTPAPEGGIKGLKFSGTQTRDVGSDGHRKDKVNEGVGGGADVVKKSWHFIKHHRTFIMTYFGLPTLSCLLGVLVTFYSVGPQHKGYLVQEAVDKVITNLTSDTRWVGQPVDQYLGREDVRKEIVDMVTNAMKETKDTVTHVTNITNVTRIEYQCLLESETQWRQFEDQLKETEEQLERQYKEELNSQMSAFMDSFKSQLDAAQDHLTSEMGTMSGILSQEFQQKLDGAEQVTNRLIEAKTQILEEKQAEIDSHLALADKLMEVKGFLKIESIGPVLVVMGVVEALLTLCVCLLIGRRIGGTTSRSHRQDAEAALLNGDAGQPSDRQPNPRWALVDTNNTNVVCLSFRDADEAPSRALGEKLLEKCSGARPRLRSFVVDSMEDVAEIPACRVGLVFVNPDEREMIIEDERYHIGQGLRRQAVQRLLDSRVEVFIIIFKDPKSATLPAGEMYNSKLGQVDEHEQLKKLKRQHRVFSIRDSFHDHQTSAIVREFSTIFA